MTTVTVGEDQPQITIRDESATVSVTGGGTGYSDAAAIDAINNDADHGATAQHDYRTDEEIEDLAGGLVSAGDFLTWDYDDPNDVANLSTTATGYDPRTDVASTTYTASAWESLWVDTGSAGAAVTITLPADADVNDGDRVKVAVVDATDDTDVQANTGQSIVGNNRTLSQPGATLTFEWKDSSSTWITVQPHDSQHDHDALLNFVANEHVDHSGVSVTAGDGLKGGGDITASRTFDIEPSDFAGAGLEDDGSDNLQLAAAAAGDGLKGGAGSALAVEPADFAGTGLEDDGSDNLQIANGRGHWERKDVTQNGYAADVWESLWVDTGAAGGTVTVTLPPDSSAQDGDRIEVGVEDATDDVIIDANTGQSILGQASDLTEVAQTRTYEFKASTSTWMVR